MTQAYGDTRQARRLVRLSMIASGAVFALAGCMVCSSTANLLWLVLLMLAAGDIGVMVYAVKQGLLFELLLERQFKHVCAGIDFTGVGRSWKYGCYGALVRGDTKIIYPKLRDCHGHRE